MVEKAEAEVCPRINTRRSVETLKLKIDELNARIAEEDRTRGNKEEVEAKYHETLDMYNRIKREVDQINSFLNVSLLLCPLHSAL